MIIFLAISILKQNEQLSTLVGVLFTGWIFFLVIVWGITTQVCVGISGAHLSSLCQLIKRSSPRSHTNKVGIRGPCSRNEIMHSRAIYSCTGASIAWLKPLTWLFFDDWVRLLNVLHGDRAFMVTRRCSGLIEAWHIIKNLDSTKAEYQSNTYFTKG